MGGVFRHIGALLALRVTGGFAGRLPDGGSVFKRSASRRPAAACSREATGRRQPWLPILRGTSPPVHPTPRP